MFYVLTDVRLKKFTEEKTALKAEIEQLHQQLINAKTQRRSGSMNGPLGDDDYEDAQSKLNKKLMNFFNFLKLILFLFPF